MRVRVINLVPAYVAVSVGFLAVLKITGLIDLSWWLVTLPLYAPVVLGLSIMAYATLAITFDVEDKDK